MPYSPVYLVFQSKCCLFNFLISFFYILKKFRLINLNTSIIIWIFCMYKKNLTNAVVFLYIHHHCIDWICDFFFKSNLICLFFGFHLKQIFDLFYVSFLMAVSRKISYHNSTTMKCSALWTWQKWQQKPVNYCRKWFRAFFLPDYMLFTIQSHFIFGFMFRVCKNEHLAISNLFFFLVENHTKNIFVKFVKLSLWF